jgi:hypothetical protein
MTSNPFVDESPASGFGWEVHSPSAWSCPRALTHCWALAAATTSLHNAWAGPLSVAQHAESASQPLLASFESVVASSVPESSAPGPESLDSLWFVTPPPQATAVAIASANVVPRRISPL